MNAETLRASLVEAYATMKTTSDALSAFPTGPNGLTPDEVKFSTPYRVVKAKFDNAFARVRALNAHARKRFPKEWKEGFFR